MTKSIAIIAASTRFATLFPSLGKFLTGARAAAGSAEATGSELSGKLRYDVGLSDCRPGRRPAHGHDVSRDMMRRCF